MTQLRRLFNEYKQLKAEIFGEDTFVIVEETDPKVIRYNQLFQYFHPQFRTKDWVSPV